VEIGKLTEMVRQLNEQIEYMKDTLNVQEQLKEMQQAEWVQHLSQGGEQLWGLAGELQHTRELLSDYETFDEQMAQLKTDVNGYFALYEQASNEQDALNSLSKYAYALSQLDDQYWTGSESPNQERLYHFSRIVNDMERVATLKRIQEANTIDLADGANARDAAIIQATDTNTMLALLLGERESALANEANQAVIDAESEKAYSAFIGYGSDARVTR